MLVVHALNGFALRQNGPKIGLELEDATMDGEGRIKFTSSNNVRPTRNVIFE